MQLEFVEVKLKLIYSLILLVDYVICFFISTYNCTYMQYVDWKGLLLEQNMEPMKDMVGIKKTC